MSNTLNIQSDFPMLAKTMHGKPLVYFDTAATALKPQVVIDSISDFYSNKYGTVHRAVYELSVETTKMYQETRVQFAEHLNTSCPEEIIFTRGTTESINFIASSFGKRFIRPGDEVIISELEHHSNIVPWQMMCEERGAILRAIPANDLGELCLDSYKELLNNKTKIVAVAHMANAIGTVHPIKEMIALAKEVGAYTLIDGAQMAPHSTIDVQDLGCDFYLFSGHKLYGPTGIGILYGRRELLEELPPFQGGGDMIEEVKIEKTTYNQPPLKFEAGTPMIAEVIGLGKALEYLNSVGLSQIAQHEQGLSEYARKKLERIPNLKIIGAAKQRGPIISFIIEGIHPLDIGTLLDLKGVAVRTGHHCAQPTMQRFGVTATVRASFGLYNTKDEVDYFVQAVQEVIECISP